MTDYVGNRIVISGNPEDIQDLKIFNGQHIEPPNEGNSVIPKSRKMMERPAADMSFKVVAPIDEVPGLTNRQIIDRHIESWGTKWDIPGDVYLKNKDDSKLVPFEPIAGMHLLYDIQFETANNPASAWLNSLHEKFPSLSIQGVSTSNCDNQILHFVFHTEDGNQTNILSFEEEEDDEAESENSEENVRNGVLESMENYYLPTPDLSDASLKIFKAIAQDDPGALYALQQDPNHQPLGSWSLLHYAVQSESVNVARDLLARGADLHAMSRYGISAMDVLMDGRHDQYAKVFCDLDKRAEMLALLVERDPQIVESTLATGLAPASLMARYGMGKMLGMAVNSHQLSQDSAQNSIGELTKNAWGENICAFLCEVEKGDHCRAVQIFMDLFQVGMERSDPQMRMTTDFDFVELLPFTHKLNAEETQAMLAQPACYGELKELMQVKLQAHQALGLVDEIMGELSPPARHP